MLKIKLVEPIHSVFQGEGVNLCKKMMVLRVAGCPIRCEKCDSKHTWAGETLDYTPEELMVEIMLYTKTHHIDHIMLTGGEPGLYREPLLKMFKAISPYYFHQWDIETTGLHRWDKFRWYFPRIQFNFSPKIGSLQGKKHWVWEGLEGKKPDNYIVKVVVSKKNWEEDLIALNMLEIVYEIPRHKIYLMPEGITRRKIIKGSKFVMEKCLEQGFSFSPRLHVMFYDKKKRV